MAIATAYYPTIMSNAQTWYGYVTIATSNQIQISSGDYVQNYYGSGFTYAYDQIVAGTVSSTDYYEFGRKIYDIKGGSYSAVTVANYVNSGNANGLISYIFQNDDTFNGSAYNDLLNGYTGNDSLKGNGGDDTLEGGAGNDSLDGGTGNDSLSGGTGDDSYVIDSTGDSVTENPGEGTDLVKVAIATANGTYTLGDNLENATLTNTVAYNLTGNALDNVLTGNAAVNILNGGDGNDTLDGGAGIDSLIGGAGDDTYIVDVAGDVISDTSGTDTVIAKLASGTYTLAAGLEKLTLSGSAAINGTGNADTNTITGNAAANILDGGAGADTLIGGAGGDTYVVDVAGDVVQETSSLASEIDTVLSSITYSLADTNNGNQLQYVEKLTLTGAADINGTGNALANTITGNSGANTLDGAGGIDTLIGGAGNDTYIVDLTATGALQDTVSEIPTTDTGDTLQLRGASGNAATVTLTLAATLENLDASATGNSKLNLTGNTAANILSGNDADNALAGLAGNDTLDGGAGNDSLDGGIGNDSLIGGTGNDTYLVDSASDSVSEGNDAGTDLVKVAIATANGTYTLGDNLENATLTNAVVYHLTGNSLDNVLTGNAAVNTLNGGDGNDTLDGGAGIDSLIGGAGDDTYIVDVTGDVISDTSGTDTVIAKLASGTYTLAAGLENLTLFGSAAINGTGNADANTITGNAAANILDGGAGADLLIGGAGGDTYVVDTAGDVVQESSSLASEIDTVQSSITYSLADTNNGNQLQYVEKLTLTGSSNINGTGNTLANTITGNTGANTLDGAGGIDILLGGAGNDTYIVDLTATGALQDTVSEIPATDTGDTLQLRGTSSNAAAVTLTLAATLENLDASATGASKLNLTGNTAANTLTGNDADNALAGLAGNDTLDGGAGNDSLDGGIGNDSLIGGTGNDTYLVDSTGDSVSEGNDAGTDLVKVAIATANGTYTLGDNLENATLTNAVAYHLTGNSLDNVLTGNAAVNTLNGGDGNDTLDGGAGIDTLIGGAGNDTYIVDVAGDVISETSGTDTVIAKLASGTYTLAAGLENLTLSGSAAINGTGNADANTITGNAAANILDGGAGADTLIGGAGGDTYVVDVAGDVVQETSSLASEIDTIQSGITYSLADMNNGNQLQYVEKLTLTGSSDINGTGNALANTITGNTGANILDGAGGIDTLIGGAGNDTYIVDLTAAGALQDTVSEIPTTDTGDTLQLRGTSGNAAAVTLTLTATLENLDASATGTSKLNLTGNTAANILTGNDADNALAGLAGNDTLYGGAGNDTLDGGIGNDSLIGGTGNDTYLVDSTVDSITEGNDAGTDLVKVGIATANGTYVLGDNIEQATLTNTVAYNLTGNALDNTLTGNAAVNTLIGNDGNDTLDGGTGIDTLVGGTGDDTYIVDVAGDVISETSGTDTVIAKLASGTYTLAAGLENLTLFGSAAINGTGNADANTISGNAAANILDGGAGADTLIGGAGGDSYVVDTAGDVVQETSSLAGEIDTVQSGITYSLADTTNGNQLQYVEKLTLTGSADINGAGNTLANTITGNTGANILDGAGGIDTLIGGAGNDTYIVDLTAAGALQDTVSEIPTTDTGDTLQLRGTSGNAAAVTLTLAATLENLDASATGTSKLNLTGNTAANILTGNDADNALAGLAGNDTLYGGAGNDTLDGGIGNDSLIGGTGNDTYLVDSIGDSITEGNDAGTDLVKVAIATANGTYTLGDNLEQATLTNTVAYNLTGNALDNVLTGNAVANILNGGDGNDTLDGGTGIDRLIGGAGNDTYIVDVAGDVISETSGTDTVIAKLASGTYTLAAGLENLTLSGSAAINGTGNADANTITGNAAANILDGGAGADTLRGGAGNDTYVVDTFADIITEEASGGIDTVKVAIPMFGGYYTLGANLENARLENDVYVAIDLLGNGLDNILTGNDRINTLDGGAGADTLIGGTGSDTYIVDLTSAGMLQDKIIETSTTDYGDLIQLRGISTNTTAVTLTLAASLQFIEEIDAGATGTSKLNLTGNAARNTLFGNDADNVILGLAGDDVLQGYAGNDTLDGGAGRDILLGGPGNDTYIIDSLADDIYDEDYTHFGLTGPQVDTVMIAIATANGTYTLGDNLEQATLTNTVAFNLTGNALDNVLTGNAAVNTLIGNGGNDTLDGGTGIDTLIGGAGNDTYIVDNLLDVITEVGSEGTDLVKVAIATSGGTYRLAENVEHAMLINAVAYNLTGNLLDNTLSGNDLANILDGGVGADRLVGGKGNDIYLVDNSSDVAVETSTLTTEVDLVKSSVTYTLSDNIENLTLLGVSHIDGTGNALINTLTGNSGNNRLDGGNGADILLGGAGNDTYVVDNLGDKVYETTASTSSIDATGVDTVEASVTWTLGNFVENLTLTGISDLNGTGNALGNLLTGNDGNNTLDGKAGVDTFIGGLGNDTYILDLSAELANVTEQAGEGDDTIVIGFSNTSTSAIDIDLSNLTSHPNFVNFENLTLTGTGLFNLTGNDDANTLIGNASINELEGNDGNDLIQGKLGNDVLTGGTGNDTFRFDTALNGSTNVDTITDFAHLEDVIQLENSIFTKLTATGSLSNANFVAGNGVAVDANDHILYNTTTGKLYYDADGNGAGAAVQFATLIGQPTLTASDFVIF